MRRLINLLVAVSVVVVATAPFTASAAVPCGSKSGHWTVVGGPRFQGSASITSLAVDPQAPDRVFTSNGRQIMRSADYGCHWKPAFDTTKEATLDDPTGGDSVVKAMGMSERGGVPLYVLVEQHIGPATRPRVFVGRNGGTQFDIADTGLPPTGVPELLRVAPSAPSTAYVVIDVAGVSDAIYATTDSGNTWSLRGVSPSNAGANDLKVDPSRPSDLWLGGGDGLYHSTDGGTSFTPVDEFTGQSVGPIDVFHRGGKARILAFSPTAGSAQISENGGNTWLVVGVPGPAQSIAHGSIADSVLIATNSSVYAFAPTVLNWVDLNPPVNGIKNLTADVGTATSFFGHTAGQIAIYQGPVARNLKIPKEIIEIPDISLLDQAPPDIAGRSRLTPATTKVRIPAGKSKTVPYDLGVPRTLTPLDVVFVVDTSSSMTQVIQEAAEALGDIYNGLATSGAAVEFGLVEYRSYPTDVPPRPETDNYVYQRVLDVGASAGQMAEGIRGLVAAGGGIYDAQLEALWQLANGDGRDVWPPGPSSRDVPPGLQMNFRQKALRVVLHVGDEPFGRETSSEDSDNNITRPEGQVARPDIPEFDAVAAALSAKDIKHLGLSLYPDATPDLRDMARATNAFAPTGGVDCDRDGAVDVPAGDPLVCVLRQDEITNANMTPAIVELVEAIRTKSAVRLDVQGPRDEVVRAVTPNSYSGVLLQADNSLEFEVMYHCPRSLQGKSTTLELTPKGLLGTAPTATTTVICGAIAEEDKPLPPIRFDQVLTLLPLIPIAPPPPPVSTSSATQAQAQAQANAAFAAQEQQQPQVAMVHQVHAEAKAALAREEEYSFTSLRKDEIPAYVPLGAATILMSTAFGVAMTLRKQAEARLNYATNRIRRR